MCFLILSSLYTNDLLKYKKFEKTCFHRGFEFIKKNFIYNAKYGTFTKVKLREFKQHSQLYSRDLVSESYCYCGDNV